jgi:NADPH-dependent curcumin reductase CurA
VGAVKPSDFRVAEIQVAVPGPGEVLVRNTWTSVDAAIRLRLRPDTPAGYSPPFPLDAPMDGIMTIGEIVDSRAEGFARGDVVQHAVGWRDFSVVPAGRASVNGIGMLTKIDTTLAPASTYLGALGGSGLSAYAGLVHAADLRAGDVVWVSAAAGAVGSLAAQFAKLRGHRVIGSAGSDAKVAFLLDELGLDAAFNYRSRPLGELLHEAAPEGIDVYFDNVGGAHLEIGIAALRRFGRVAICGMVSEYETESPPAGPRNLFLAVANDLTIRGFRRASYQHLFPDLVREVSSWIREGRLYCRETVIEGLDRAPEALATLMSGDSTGKTLVRIDAAA